MDLLPRKIWAGDKADSSSAMLSAAIDLSCSMSENKKIEQEVTDLFEILRMPVYQYLMTIFGNAAQAEDLTQDAFLQLYKALLQGQTIHNVRFWIFRVAHNLSVSHHRQNKFMAPLSADSWQEIERQLPDKGLNPEQNVLQQEQYQRIYERMKRLSAQERQTLHLRAEGFKYKEIAEIMNVAVPTVGEFLRRGIKKLAEHK